MPRRHRADERRGRPSPRCCPPGPEARGEVSGPGRSSTASCGSSRRRSTRDVRRGTGRGRRSTPTVALAAGRHLSGGSCATSSSTPTRSAGSTGRSRRQRDRPGPPAHRRGPQKEGEAQALGTERRAEHQGAPGLRPAWRVPGPAPEPGQAADGAHFAPVLAAIRVPRPGPGRPADRPDRLLADKGSSYPIYRRYPCAGYMPRPARAGRPPPPPGAPPFTPGFDPEAYKHRNVVERCINRLERSAGWPPAYKTTTAYHALVTLAALLLWLPK